MRALGTGAGGGLELFVASPVNACAMNQYSCEYRHNYRQLIPVPLFLVCSQTAPLMSQIGHEQSMRVLYVFVR